MFFFGLSNAYIFLYGHRLGPSLLKDVLMRFFLLFVREPGQPAPPTWPAKILQKIARYVFETENKETSSLILCSKLTNFPGLPKRMFL
jgi:hypothetical protein